MGRILVIEDERDLQELLRFNLAQDGHEVILSGEGLDGLRLARERAPHLVLLDLMLPDLSGMEVFRRMRAEPGLRDLPVVIVTARGDEIDRIVGLELGAEDYIVKPYSVRELRLRVSAVLRRGERRERSDGEVQFGILTFDRNAYRAWIKGEEVQLTALEFRLLAFLFDNKNRVQVRRALLSAVWGIDAQITTRTVDTHVKRLREKLGSAGDYIETVRGVGYRFVENPDESVVGGQELVLDSALGPQRA